MRRAIPILLLTLVAAGQARASEAAETMIVQNRTHRLRFEIAAGAALLPADAYTKEAGGTASLTYHVTDLIAWEAVHLHVYAPWRSGLRAQLEDNFGLPPQRFPVLRYALDSNFVVSPLYAKLSVLNGRHLVRMQIFGVIGLGLGLVDGGEPEAGSTLPGQPLHVAVLGDIGLGVRVWLSRSWSARFDLRQYMSIDTATREVTPPLYLSLSVAVSLGGRR